MRPDFNNRRRIPLSRGLVPSRLAGRLLAGRLFGLRGLRQVGAVGALVGLDVLELSARVTDGVELRAFAAAMRGAPGLRHETSRSGRSSDLPHGERGCWHHAPLAWTKKPKKLS